MATEATAALRPPTATEAAIPTLPPAGLHGNGSGIRHHGHNDRLADLHKQGVRRSQEPSSDSLSVSAGEGPACRLPTATAAGRACRPPRQRQHRGSGPTHSPAPGSGLGPLRDGPLRARARRDRRDRSIAAHGKADHDPHHHPFSAQPIGSLAFSRPASPRKPRFWGLHEYTNVWAVWN